MPREYPWKRNYDTREERDRVRSLPRVMKAKERRFGGGDLFWTEHITPRDAQLNPVTSLVSWIEYFAPGAKSLKHGHQNEAIFYILEGRGYEIHNGKRYKWKKGDVVIVPGGSVHQHFNADSKKRAVALVINPKPLYFFLNLIYQRHLEHGSSVHEYGT